MDERYVNVKTPPKYAMNTITAGRLKGKTDIKPQWRIEALTETYGLCGIGWYVEEPIVSHHEMPGGEASVEMIVKLHIWDKEKNAWSAPIVGVGGDRIIKFEKGKLYLDEDAYKKCFTDAVGKAASMIGVGASVYMGESGKYAQESREHEAPLAVTVPAPAAQGGNVSALRKRLIAELNQRQIAADDFVRTVFNKSLNELKDTQITTTLDRIVDSINYYHHQKTIQQNAEEEEIPFE